MHTIEGKARIAEEVTKHPDAAVAIRMVQHWVGEDGKMLEVAKGHTASRGGQRFKMISHEDVVRTLRPILAQVGLSVLANVAEVKIEPDAIYVALDVTFRGARATEVTSRFYGASQRRGAAHWEMEAAVTYAYKTALIRTFMVPGSEDLEAPEPGYAGDFTPTQINDNVRQVPSAEEAPSDLTPEQANENRQWLAQILMAAHPQTNAATVTELAEAMKLASGVGTKGERLTENQAADIREWMKDRRSIMDISFEQLVTEVAKDFLASGDNF